MIDLCLLQNLKASLRGENKLSFVRAKSTAEMKQLGEVQNKYPVWVKILSTISNGKEINEAMAEFLIAIIEHTEDVYEFSPRRNLEDYNDREGGEIGSQFYPNFPLRF